MKQKDKKLNKFKLWIRVIALILVIAFLWQDVLWAHPDILAKGTLATKTLPTDQNTAQAFERFTLAYVKHKISGTEDMYTLSAVREEWWPFIKNAAYELFKHHKLELEEVPVVSDMTDGAFVNEGFVKITFSNKDELIIYDPEIYKDIPPGAIDIIPEHETTRDREYLKVAFVENSTPAPGQTENSTPKNVFDVLPELVNAPQDLSLGNNAIDVAQDEPEGNAIVGYKIVSASIIGALFAILFLFAGVLHNDYFIGFIALIYFLTTGVLPVVTGIWIDHNLTSFKRSRKEDDKREKKEVKREEKDPLIFPFKSAGNIRNIHVPFPASVGKISYYPYKLGKLFVDKTAMRRMPKLLQWVIWFHEWLHGKWDIRTEAFAVPLTFCAPWFVVILSLLGLDMYIGMLSPASHYFLLLLGMYNIFALGIGMLFARVIGTEETSAGHYTIKPRKRKKLLTDPEIDAYIAKEAHSHTRYRKPDEIYYWRDWLCGSSRGTNVVFIPCKDQTEDIIIYKAAYKPGTKSNSNYQLARQILASKGNHPVRLVIADYGAKGKPNKEKRRIRVEKILKEAQKLAPDKLIRVSIRSTKYDLTRLRDLMELYRRRLERIKHNNVARELVGSEISGNLERLVWFLDWARANDFKILHFMGDTFGKEGYGFEGFDILRAHMDSGANPKLDLRLGIAEHLFLLSMLGDDELTNDWPRMIVFEGPAVMESLKRLARGERISNVPSYIRSEDIRRAKEFEDILEGIIRRRGDKPTPAMMNAERVKWYRFHPKMVDIANFIAQHMRFVFSESIHHNVYLIGRIPENFTRKGLKHMEALSQMEDEFRQCTLRGLRLHRLMQEAWVEEHTMNVETSPQSRIEADLKRVYDLIAKINEEKELNKKLNRELIENKVLDEMLEILRNVIERLTASPESTGGELATDDRATAGEVLIREEIESIYGSLEERLIRSTRQANYIFREVFNVPPQDSLFAITPTEDGIQRSSDSTKTRQDRRLEIGVNTFKTSADFPSDDYQDLGYVSTLDEYGLRILEVDSLSPTGEMPAFRLVLTFTEATEFIKGQSIEGVAKRKLKGAEEIVKDYDDLLINIPKMKYRKGVSTIGDISYYLHILMEWLYNNARDLLDYLTEMFSNVSQWFKHCVRSLRSQSLSEYEAELEKGLKILSQGDPEDAEDGLVVLGDAFISECATKNDRRTIMDRLLRSMGIGCDADMTRVAAEVLENILALPIKQKGDTREMCKDALDRVYFWISRLGTSKDEKEYKRRVFSPLVNALMRNEKFRMYIAEFANENPSEHKTRFVLELLSTTPEVKIGQDISARISIRDVQEFSATLTAPYPAGMTEREKQIIDTGKQNAANQLRYIAISGISKRVELNTNEYLGVGDALLSSDSDAIDDHVTGLADKLIRMMVGSVHGDSDSNVKNTLFDDMILTLRYTVDRLADALGSKNVDGYIKRVLCCTGLHQVAMNQVTDTNEIAIHAVERLINALTSSKVDDETKRACIVVLGDVSRQRLDEVGRHARKLLENAFLSKKIRGSTREALQTVLLRIGEHAIKQTVDALYLSNRMKGRTKIIVQAILVHILGKIYIAKLLWKNQKIWMLFKFLLKEIWLLLRFMGRGIKKYMNVFTESRRKPVGLSKYKIAYSAAENQDVTPAKYVAEISTEDMEAWMVSQVNSPEAEMTDKLPAEEKSLTDVVPLSVSIRSKTKSPKIPQSTAKPPEEKKVDRFSTKGKINHNLTYIMPRMRRALFELSEKAKNNDMKEIVVLLDVPSEQSEEIKTLIRDYIIKPLMRMNGNNSTIERALERIRFADSGDIGTIENRITLTRTLKSEDVIIITGKTRLDEFKKFKNSFITALDFSNVNKSQKFYCPYIEATLFAVMRALDVDGNCLWYWYNRIPNTKKIDENELIRKCFDINGNPIREVILELVESAEPFNDINTPYEFGEYLLRHA